MERPGLPEHLRHRIGGPAPVAPVLLQVALLSRWSSDYARSARLLEAHQIAHVLRPPLEPADALAEVQRKMGHNDLDVFHGCHCRDITIDVSSGLSRATVEVIEIGQQVRPPDPQLSGATRP